MTESVIITGGLGFIGGHAVDLFVSKGYDVHIVDKCTYAADISKTRKKVKSVIYDDISTCNWMNILVDTRPSLIVNLAAESSVDMSIHSAHSFIQSNIAGVYSLVSGVRQYQEAMGNRVCVIHTSTDEVTGDTDVASDKEFTEKDKLSPNNPYSATKAAAEHILHSCRHTYGDVDYVIVRGCNNYGPGQHCEKFIPMVINNALHNESIPIHGTGCNIREWIYVKDFARSFYFLYQQYQKNVATVVGNTYNVGSGIRYTNTGMAKEILNKMCKPHELLKFGLDRPGNDRRYAVCSNKIQKLGFVNMYTHFHDNIINTIKDVEERYAKG